ncbi:hypothetical protein OE749_17440 [Aestuariibacter sp. AA17]|uniref:Spi protease inhibitor domain-containing protein n=1 Tax=Fluctibacter corallii TaxID=2984329 RepID=A0ABT3ACX0_9ALTE|nr:hypothetical protein [Aestuariibacter sp. AA17]MCV2886483.1 hypothetical protein [Aestuariibacter sp. AA17]
MIRLILVLFFSLSIHSCSKNTELSSEQMESITKEADTVMSTNSLLGVEIDTTGYSEISDLNPNKVYVTKDGVYIVLSSMFVSESGLFVSAKTFDIDAVESGDPCYKFLADRLYQYKIKG